MSCSEPPSKVLGNPLAPIFKEGLRFPGVKCRRTELLNVPGDRFPEAVVGEDAHELAEINVSYTPVAADDDEVFVIVVHTRWASVGGAGERNRFAAAPAVWASYPCRSRT